MQITNGVIGHRGASGYAPENTLGAFDKALALGCHFLEFDVMLSADGEPFVFHDESLKRTTNGFGEMGLVNADYLATLDAGLWFSKTYRGEKIPHFRDALKWLTFTNSNANIEIKPYRDKVEQTTLAVMTYVTRFWPKNKAFPLLSSFHHDALTLCRSLAPEMPLGLLLDKWDENSLRKADDLQCYSIHLNKQEVDSARIDAIKSKGYKLFVYTVNNKRQAKRLLNSGVDAVFSDYPDLLA